MSSSKYDVFLSHHSADKPDVEKLATILERRGCRTWLDKWNLAAGNAWQPELEQALFNSNTCAVFVGTSGLGPWQNQEMRLAIQRQVESRQTDRPFRVIPVLLPGATRGDRAKLPPFLTANTWVEFSRAVDDDPDALEKLVAGLKGLPVRPCLAGEPELRDGPYRGLEFFDVQHAGLFFGRDDLVDWLLSCLRGTQSKDGPTRFLAILGASGSGKSSLARAGLLNALSKGALRDSAAWPQAICRPGSRPLESLVKALASVKDFNLGQGSYADVYSQAIAALRRSPDSLHLSVLGGLRALPSAQRLVLLVDQFEELFTLAANPENVAAAAPPGPDRQQQEAERQAFIDNLLHAATVEDGPVLVILTMRADFCGKCARYPSLADAIASHQSLVGTMADSQLREAILRPAELVKGRFDPGLADLLVNEVRDEPGALPLLQFALKELWKRQEADRFTVEAYREIGGLRGALERHANGVLQKLGGKTERELCRRILLRLVQPGEGTEDTKRRVAWREILPDAADQAPVEAVIKRLADERLIVTEGELPSQNAFVEISHEALIHAWGEFGKWIDADRAGLRTHRRLTEAADEWARSHADPSQRDAGLLYQDTRLAVAKDWADKHPQELNQFEREFLEASWRSQEDERRRELETARRLAEEAAFRQAETARAQDAEAASRRQRKVARIAWGIAAAAIFSLTFAVWQSVRLADVHRQQTGVVATLTANDEDFLTAVGNLREHKDKDTAIAALRQVIEDPKAGTDQKGKAAVALVAFGVSVTAAMPVLALADDPSGRTRLIHAYPRFHGDLLEAARALEAAQADPDDKAADFRSGLCAALGLIPWDKMQGEEQAALRTTLVGLYTRALDGRTHNAACFALKRWGREIPDIPFSKLRRGDDRGWLINSLGMTMIRIPPGSFTRGDPSIYADPDEKPARTVELRQDFYLCDREVTVRQFRNFFQQAPVDPKCTEAEKKIAESWLGEDTTVSPEGDYPVQQVTWFQAVAFCNWLSRCDALEACYRLRETGTDADCHWTCDLDASASGYRLPSEAQWEYACRSESQKQYAFGDDERLLPEYGHYDNNSKGRTRPAGQKLPNGWGLFDMHGNVYEWCQDAFDKDYYANSPDVDPTGPSKAGPRMMRGGCWERSARGCRAAYRYRNEPQYQDKILGFRVAAVAKAESSPSPESR